MSGPPFVKFLTDLAEAHRLNGWVLLPMQDQVVELVARNTDELSRAYRLVTQPWETLRWAHDKRLAYRVARELGIACPTTWYPADEAELSRMDIAFPAIVKPAMSIGMQHAIGRKALEAWDMDRLRYQYRAACAVVDPEQLMVQEVIPGNGHNQFAVGAFCADGRLLGAMTARRTRQFPFDYGWASSFVEALEVPGLVEIARALCGRLRLSGMVEVEFKLDRRDDLYKLLDINVRPWGWHALCIACGLDFPYAQYQQALQETIELSAPRYGFRWRRLITDIPAGLQEIRRGRTTPRAYLRSLRGPIVPSVFDWRDPLPALGDIVAGVKSALLGRARKKSSRAAMQAGRDAPSTAA
jgi:D-aspartate ligase